MKNLAFAAICIGSLGLLACGSSSGGEPDARPIDTNPDAAGNPPACNPIANTGCPATEKCTYLVESTDPFLGRTTCAPDGTVPLNGDCTRGEDGNDNCEGKLWCLSGTCSEICSAAPDSCAANFTCVSFVDLFDDVDNAGLCQPACNPVSEPSDCPAGEGCYLNLGTGKASCANPYTQDPASLTGATSCATDPAGQGCNCTYLNGCKAGYGCALNNEPGNAATGLECAFFCDVLGGGGPTCSQGPGPSFSCRQIMTFYSNSENVPEEIGFCVNPEEWPCVGCVDESAPGCSNAPPSDCDCPPNNPADPLCGV